MDLLDPVLDLILLEKKFQQTLQLQLTKPMMALMRPRRTFFPAMPAM
jgi:hypothetical protein